MVGDRQGEENVVSHQVDPSWTMPPTDQRLALAPPSYGCTYAAKPVQHDSEVADILCRFLSFVVCLISSAPPGRACGLNVD